MMVNYQTPDKIKPRSHVGDKCSNKQNAKYYMTLCSVIQSQFTED